MGKDAAVWTEGLIDIFVDLCIKEVDNNNRPHTHFSPKGWENLINNFTKETGKAYTKKQLKNKWNALKKDWKLWKDLKGKETGLGWDSVLQTIDASDEWWNEKIKSAGGEEYGKFRKKGISPDFEAKLDKMFMSISANGSNAYAPSSSLPLPTRPVQCDIEIDLEEGSGDSEEVGEPKTTKRKGRERVEKGKGVATKREKVGGAAYLGRQITRMVEVLESTSTSVISARTSAGTSIKEVMQEVSLLPGMVQRSPLYFFTTQLFCNADKREMFCTMEDPNLKLEWLKFEQANWK